MPTRSAQAQNLLSFHEIGHVSVFVDSTREKAGAQAMDFFARNNHQRHVDALLLLLGQQLLLLGLAFPRALLGRAACCLAVGRDSVNARFFHEPHDHGHLQPEVGVHGHLGVVRNGRAEKVW